MVNEAGERAFGFDRVIYDDEIVHHQIDLPPLPSGDYRAKLIVYNFATRASVPGVLVESQTPFKREVDIGALRID